MTKRRWNEPPTNLEQDEKPSPNQPLELEPYEEDDAPTLPWLPKGDHPSRGR